MNTDKLLQAIQILVKEELKQQLPTLIKEAVRSEMKKVLAEQKQPKNTGLSMAKAILGEEKPKMVETKEKEFSKNPMINQILNETRTAKMGYGEFAGGAQKSGLGVQTGVAELDKAFNRDYSELVKRFKK